MIGIKLANRYEIVRSLGEGSMGVVYLARDPMLERDVAIKLVKQHLLTDESSERFRREALIIARFDHPSLVSVHDTGDHEGSLFFVMPFVEGESLRSLIKKGALSTDDVLEIGIQVAEALEYSHMRGIVHRDIKPENVLITSEPQGLRARVTDFGLALTTEDQRITGVDIVVGTVAYLCPESVIGKNADARSDIYSLGAMLYECLSGRTPYVGDIRSILFGITYEDPPHLKEVAPHVNDEINEIVMQCLRRLPSLRPQRAQDVADQLSRLRFERTGWEIPARAGRKEASVGRTLEYAELVRRLEAATQGQAQLVLIGGDAGVGKSFLVDQLNTLARARRIPVYRGRFHERDRAFPFQGFSEVCQDFFRSADATGIDFSDLAGELSGLFPSLAEPNRFLVPRSEQPIELETAADRAALHDLLARTLIRFSEAGPAIIVLEDLHHGAEATTALQPILSRLDRSPILIIGTYRNTEITKDHPVSKLIRNLTNEKNFCLIELKPLGLQDHRRLVESLMLNSEPDEEFLEKLYEATEGNPYFTKEVIRSLAESGVLIPFENGRLVVSGDLEMTFDSLPATVQQTIEARMRKLKEPLQDVLSAASVLGKTFDAADLIFLLEKDDKVEDAIDALIADGFLEEDRETYRSDRLRFSSAMVRDASYARLSRRRRKAYHKKYAEELEHRNENFLERVYPNLIHHYSRSGEAEKVVEYGIDFARKTLRTFSTEEVIRALEMVLEFGPGVREGEVRRLMAKAYRIQGEPGEALEQYTKAIDIFQRFGDVTRAVESMALAAETAWHFRRTEDARVWIEKGIPAARSAATQISLKKLLSLGATAANLRGDYETARVYMKELDRLEKTAPTVIATNTSGLLHIPVGGIVYGLDPSRVFSLQEEETIPLIFETLTRQGRAAGIRPWLAAEYYAENSGRTFHFRLRENVRFHNGKVLTARDVSYSLHRLLSSNLSRKRWLLSGVKEIQIITDHEFRIHLERPIAFFPALLADTSCAIVPEGTPRIGFNWREDCAGTGPFKVTRFEPGKILELEAFHDYWRPGYPKSQKLVFTFGVSPDQILSGFRSGLFSLAWDLQPESVEELLRDTHFGAQYKETPSLSTYYIALNTHKGVFQDEYFRQAFIRSLDVKPLVYNYAGRPAIPAGGLIPPGLLGYEPPSVENVLSVSTDSVSTEAVRVSDHEIILTGDIHPIFEGAYATLRDEIFEALKHKGFTVRNVEPKLRTDQPPPATADFELGRWIADYPDPDGVFYLLLKTENALLGRFCGSKELDELIDRGRSEINPLARHQLYREIERYISDHALLLPLFHEQSYRFALKEVQEFEVSFSRPVVPYEKLWIQR
jgi:ABC-type transport system substrate-binding protein/tRNA A-37 threonylcarbamoyl transferase component Bud32